MLAFAHRSSYMEKEEILLQEHGVGLLKKISLGIWVFVYFYVRIIRWIGPIVALGLWNCECEVYMLVCIERFNLCLWGLWVVCVNMWVYEFDLWDLIACGYNLILWILIVNFGWQYHRCRLKISQNHILFCEWFSTQGLSLEGKAWPKQRPSSNKMTGTLVQIANLGGKMGLYP